MRMDPVDLNRLVVILRHPESIVALEAFNELIYRPSESMIESLINLFIHSIQQEEPLQGQPPNQHYHNPLFILLLIKRLILHSHPNAPLQPSKSNLAISFSQLFLPTFFNLNSIVSSSHLPLLDRLDQQLIVCITHLSTRLVHSNPYHQQLHPSTVDPLLELITPIHQALLSWNEHYPSHSSSTIHSIRSPLKIIKNVIRGIYNSNSIRAISILQKITRTHFESLYSIYQKLILISSTFPNPNVSLSSEDAKSIYQSIDSILKIFKMMVEPLVELTSHLVRSQEGNHDQNGSLDQVLQKFISDFQTCLDSQLQMIDHHAFSNSHHHGMVHTPQEMISNPDSFSPHVIQYGEIILRLQSSRPSIINHDVIKVYLQILEFVSSQIVTHHPSGSAEESLMATTLDRRLLKFYPLLIQALKLLNNALNPWTSYDSQLGRYQDTTSSHDPTGGGSLIQTLTADDNLKLVSILQPFLNANFASDSYFEGRPFRDDHSSDDEELDEDEDDESDDQETIEEIEEEDQRLGPPPEESHQYDDDDRHPQEIISKDDPRERYYAKEEDHHPHLLDLHHRVPNHHYHLDHLIVNQKEPLRLEIEELLLSLQSLIHPANQQPF